MANVTTAYGFRFCDSLVGHAELKELLPTAATAIARGDAIIANTGTTATADLALSSSGALLGISARTVTAAEATLEEKLLYYPAFPWYVFHGKCSGTYAAASDDFTVCDIEGGTGVMYVNEDKTTESCIQIIGLLDQLNNVAGLNANVRFIIIRSLWIPLLAAI